MRSTLRMGHVYVDLEIVNPEKPELLVKHKALVDTGATYTVVPRDVCSKLGLKIEGSKAVKTASGIDVLDMSYSRISINGKSGVSTILVSDTLEQILVGVVTLEILGLTIDPTTGRLNEVEALLL